MPGWYYETYMCLLKIENLSVKTAQPGKTRAVPILKEINLDIAKDKITALIGESGAGKSMLAKTISALLPENIQVTSGRFFYEGREVDSRWLKKVRGREIFYAPQNAAASFNPVLKLGSAIPSTISLKRKAIIKSFCGGAGGSFFKKRPLLAEGIKSIKRLRRASPPAYREAIEILKVLGIEDPLKLLNSYPFELSEGENQRALLTLAILQNPRLLILDEPASALDAAARRDFMKLINNVRGRRSLSILLITHDLAIVRHIADYIYIILNGEIVEAGETVPVFQRPSHPYTREITGLICR
ncbi:MAG: ABC transporter ATP-binding protein [Candidatus Aminicenantes bacterium]|nr:ABC transporter ATP-binding protein [Candidatus Aminicenantes bacterium]